MTDAPADAFGPDYEASQLMMAANALLTRGDDELRGIVTDLELTASAIACRIERLHAHDARQRSLPL